MSQAKQHTQDTADCDENANTLAYPYSNLQLLTGKRTPGSSTSSCLLPLSYNRRNLSSLVLHLSTFDCLPDSYHLSVPFTLKKEGRTLALHYTSSRKEPEKDVRGGDQDHSNVFMLTKIDLPFESGTKESRRSQYGGSANSGNKCIGP
jgi:hypothetical protein